MSIEFIYPEFEVIRNENRCITCRICQQQCANGVHSYNSETKQMVCDESNCVNCQRCVSFCPTRAFKNRKERLFSTRKCQLAGKYDERNL